ncbi:uncharacterized protein LOC113337813 [Papaver somniferum]|uniref:uncharacterized protein LOC113337813 n=1 Tax=Papaver somniferum TaxID=3469 RepID=UPI000E702C89|nr:uncharacterized protein LOC113337813 [Papaver somniferum]
MEVEQLHRQPLPTPTNAMVAVVVYAGPNVMEVITVSTVDLSGNSLHENNYLIACVETIPKRFKSAQHYLGSYTVPLLEETRMEICSRMEFMSGVPHAEMISVEGSKQHGGSILYRIKVDFWRHRYGVSGKELYKPKPLDLLILGDTVPEVASDLQRFRSNWSLASVVEDVKESDSLGDEDRVVYFQVKTSKTIKIEMKEGIWKPRFVVFLVKENCSLCSAEVDRILAGKLIHNYYWILMNLKELWYWGLYLQTLACAPKNVAVAELALRILNIQKDASESDFGKNKSSCSLGDFLLFGNMNTLELCNDLGKIYVDYRVDSLVECFAPSTGWKKHFDSMVDFLEDCVSRYRLHLKNVITTKVHVLEKVGTNSEVHMSLVRFGKDRFRALAVPLKRSIRILCTHLPKRLLLGNFEKMDTLCGLLESFDILLSQNQVADEEFEELFALQENYSKEGSRALSSSYNLHEVDLEPLDFLVIDEAAQLKECESVIPMQLEAIRHAVLIGDECHPQARVKSRVSDEAGFGRSLFERLGFFGHSEDLLNMQVEIDEAGLGIKNMVEVAVVMAIIRTLFEARERSKYSLSIGIISPYPAQIAAIENKVGQKYEKLKDFIVKVMSADGCYGSEEDVIIISTAGSNHSGLSDGFLSNPQCTNVALTRGRHCLWILGDDKKLCKIGSFWEDLIRDAKSRQCFFNADEDEELVNEMFKANKELDQLDNLLSENSMLFKSALWKVLFSNNFRKSFGKLKSSQTQKSVVNRLVELSNGWRPKKLKVKTSCGNSTQLVKQYKVGKLYIISSVDVAKYSCYTQVLKIWDILPLEEIPKLVKSLESILSIYTDEYLERYKREDIKGDMVVPVTWRIDDEMVRYKNTDDAELVDSSVLAGRCYIENSKVRDSLLLMKPGTGKTTVLTMKLFQKEQQHYFSSKGPVEATRDVSLWDPAGNVCRVVEDETKGTVLRQLFVTVSPKLCAAVKNQISKLKSSGRASTDYDSLGSANFDDAVQYRDTPDLRDIPPESSPLVITFQNFLMMLDGSTRNSYFDRFGDVRVLSQSKIATSRSFALCALRRTKEVTYERFSSSYWPHFNYQMTKKLDPSMVFIEITSHIKGGLLDGRLPDDKLSRDDYIKLSDGRGSSISKEIRKMVYDIFLEYEKKKILNDEFDLADFVIDLHRRLKTGCYEGVEMDFVYIDEVQDLTMRQIGLFKYICRNFVEGFVFSGDTAQTIAGGVDFRFQDARSLFYNEFILDSGSDGVGNAKDMDQSRISDIYVLNQNFRTHAGVLNLSQSVIELLYVFFPQHIDNLSPETSAIYGEAPILLESAHDALLTIFGKSGENAGRSTGGFGAE